MDFLIYLLLQRERTLDLRFGSELLRAAWHLEKRGAALSVNRPKLLELNYERATMSFVHLVEVFYAIWSSTTAPR